MCLGEPVLLYCVIYSVYISVCVCVCVCVGIAYNALYMRLADTGTAPEQ